MSLASRPLSVVVSGATAAQRRTLLDQLGDSAAGRRLEVTDGGDGATLACAARTADVALLLVCGGTVGDGTRRDALVATVLGVPHLVVCATDIDDADSDAETFDRIVTGFTSFSQKLEISDVAFVPVDLATGDNVHERPASMPWHDGPPLAYHLRTVHTASDENLVDVRLSLDRCSPDAPASTWHAQLASGILRAGEELILLPSGVRTAIEDISVDGVPVAHATPPSAVVARFPPDATVRPGDLACRATSPAVTSRELEATVVLMPNARLVPGQRVTLACLNQRVSAEILVVHHRIDPASMSRIRDPAPLTAGAVGRIRLRCEYPMAFDDHRRNRTTGAVEVRDGPQGATLALGALRDGTSVDAPTPSAGVTWDVGQLTRERRWDAFGTAGCVVWITGLPASGKSTLAAAVEEALVQARRLAYRLDGDNVRHGLSVDLGFSPPDRAENVRRVAQAASLLADAGQVVLVALVSPLETDRQRARTVVEDNGLRFHEVFVDTPLGVCEERDPKGLYARARRGEIRGMTGIDDPYEPPTAPDLVVHTTDTLTAQVGAILGRLGLPPGR